MTRERCLACGHPCDEHDLQGGHFPSWCDHLDCECGQVMWPSPLMPSERRALMSYGLDWFLVDGGFNRRQKRTHLWAAAVAVIADDGSWKFGFVAESLALDGTNGELP